MSLYALVVSDSCVLATLLQHHFMVLKWSCDAMTISTAVGKSSQSLDYSCVVMVVDRQFAGSYGSVVEEVGHFFRNLARHTPFYLIFEHEYESRFHHWLSSSKGLYQLGSDVSRLQDAVNQIASAESGGSDPSGFMPPASSL